VPKLPDDMISNESRPQWLPKVLVDIIQRATSRNPEDRPSFKAICDLLRAFE